jgi:hypothetical protein
MKFKSLIAINIVVGLLSPASFGLEKAKKKSEAKIEPASTAGKPNEITVRAPKIEISLTQESIDQLKKLEATLISQETSPAAIKLVDEAVEQSKVLAQLHRRDWVLQDPRQMMTALSASMFMQSSIINVLTMTPTRDQHPAAIVRKVISESRRSIELALQMGDSKDKTTPVAIALDQAQTNRDYANDLLLMMVASQQRTRESVVAALENLKTCAEKVGQSTFGGFADNYIKEIAKIPVVTEENEGSNEEKSEENSTPVNPKVSASLSNF